MANLIMPHRRGKIKEESMNLQELLLDLDMSVNKISRGINAVTLMSAGLDREMDPCVDGFDAICDYLFDISQTLRTQLDACLEAV